MKTTLMSAPPRNVSMKSRCSLVAPPRGGGGLHPFHQPGLPVLQVIQHREKVCKNAQQTPLDLRGEPLVHRSRGGLPAPITLVVTLKEDVFPILISLPLQGTQLIHHVRWQNVLHQTVACGLILLGGPRGRISGNGCRDTRYFTAMYGDGQPIPSAKHASYITKIVDCVKAGMAGPFKASRRSTD